MAPVHLAINLLSFFSRIGAGLRSPGETKQIRHKLYILSGSNFQLVSFLSSNGQNKIDAMGALKIAEIIWQNDHVSI